MKVIYCLSIFKAESDEVEAARGIADNTIVTKSDEWHRFTWFHDLSVTTLSQDVVTLLGQRQGESLAKRFRAAGLLSSRLVTLFTVVEGLNDYRTLFG